MGARAVPGPGIELTPAQELAIALRHLDDVGWCENMTGHITVQHGRPLPREPVGLVVGRGPRERPPHHRRRRHRDSRASGTSPLPCTSTPSCTASAPTPRVVVHNHPPYATALAAIGELPELVHQNSSILADELVLVTDYDGEVDQPTLGADLADRIGDASVALLVSHGVIVTAPTIEEAVVQVGAVRTHVHAALARALRWIARRSRSRRRIRSSSRHRSSSALRRCTGTASCARSCATSRTSSSRSIGVAMAIPLEELQAKQGLHHRGRRGSGRGCPSRNARSGATR